MSKLKLLSEDITDERKARITQLTDAIFMLTDGFEPSESCFALFAAITNIIYSAAANQQQAEEHLVVLASYGLNGIRDHFEEGALDG